MADRDEDVEAESEDELYEVVNITDYARRHQWWSRVFGNSTGPIAEKYSVTSQIMMGGVTGWCAGYLFQRVGKIVATAVGGGFLLLQFKQFLPAKIQGLYPYYCFFILTAHIHDCFSNSLDGLRIANHSGYVQVDWRKVEKDVNKAKKHLKKNANKAAPELNSFIEDSTEFVKRNIVISGGFVGGFLLGLAS